MGRIKLCGVLLVIIIASCVMTYFFLESETESLIEKLEQVEASVENGEREKAMEQAAELKSAWDGYMDTAGIFVRDEKLSNVNGSISRLYPMIKKDCEELGGEFANARTGLEWILRSEVPVFSNIL